MTCLLVIQENKKVKNFLKKELSNQIRIFLIVNFPMRPELVFLLPFIC